MRAHDVCIRILGTRLGRHKLLSACIARVKHPETRSLLMITKDLGKETFDFLHGFSSLGAPLHVAEPRRVIEETLERRPRKVYRRHHLFTSPSSLLLGDLRHVRQ